MSSTFIGPLENFSGPIQHNTTVGQFARNIDWKATGRNVWGATKSVRSFGSSIAKTVFTGKGHRAGMDMAKLSLGLPVKNKAMNSLFGRGIGLAFTGIAAYEGYKKEGAWGAVKGIGGSIVENYIFGQAMHLAGGFLKGAMAKVVLPTVAAGLGAAAIYASNTGQAFSQAFRPLARGALHEHMRKHAKLEMGTPVVDDFGTVATMRQRSLQAIQESKINGRSALGNEALLMYSPYFR